MVSLCSKLKYMVKDEKKAVKEYSDLKSEIEEKDIDEECAEVIEEIAEDEDRHHHGLEKIMKELKCK